jgi:mannose/fructose/N-acetylgalactosamine-specific phosphotransferase system component IIB
MNKRSFWIAIVLILVLGALLYSGKIGSIKIGTDNERTELEIKTPETRPAQSAQAPSTEINVGNIEKTGGTVQVGTNQTIGSPDKEKPAASPPSSSVGETSISVGNITETKGDVQIGSNQTMHPDTSQAEQ